MIKTRRLQAAAFGLAFSGILALAACGGDDSSSSTTKATTTEADSSKATTADDTTDTSIDTSDVDALSADECRDLYAKLQKLGFDPNSDDASPDDIQAALEEIKSQVPKDLRGDVETLAKAFETLQGLDTSDLSDPKVLEAFQALDTPEFEQASARLDAYFQNCEDATSGG